ncbi:enoyl-ACP reductase FabI [Thermus thermamylovorans]|uniref:Enoyl-[acyl-carrier-protein] reductase [NADH] n=1 Tax=Thermus thermamylovorans TaxID=2509362 RepID=A0A4Q9B8I8_9DEIN|nr:enoyl-ACP reductase [Thermus thermamylovorans]TBH21198.1 enoyl-ACP reductase [Thermus thermamylovorans]
MLTLDLSGKKALVMGVTNQRSLGYAIAEKLHQAGAELAFSYQGERLKDEVERLAAPLGALTFQADATRDEELDRLFAGIKEAWGGLDYLVHAIAFAPREAMEGRYLDTRREDWLLALEVSAYSLVAAARRAEALLREGGGIVTLTYHASRKVVPRYNVMAIAKAALEASVRYLAFELGPKGVRVNAISAGPVRTVAARSIPGFTRMYDRVAQVAPLGRNITQEEVGNLGLFLLSPLAGGITGEVVYVDAGYHIMGMEL